MKSINSSILKEFFSGLLAGRCPLALAGGCSSSKQRSARGSRASQEMSGTFPAEPRGTGRGHCLVPPLRRRQYQSLSFLAHPSPPASISIARYLGEQPPNLSDLEHKTAIQVSPAIIAALHNITEPALPRRAAKGFSPSVSNHCAIGCKTHCLGLT